MADEQDKREDGPPEDERAADSEPAAAAEEVPQAETSEVVEVVEAPESAPWPRHLSVSLRLLVAGVVLCSVAYPAAITVAGQALWPAQARGSMVEYEGRAVGSGLIGQQFAAGRFFHPRPSSKGYDGMDSGSQNLGALNEGLTARVQQRLETLEAEGIPAERVPVGWVSESGSALDPHITPAAARLQLPRVTRATGLSRSELEELVEEHTEGRFLGVFGQRRVNVLLLNLEVQKRLDKTE
ncbi:MAG: potassium-transporting ATPase subunit KdpC [Candidatus Brocadiia bacterium]